MGLLSLALPSLQRPTMEIAGPAVLWAHVHC